MVDRGHHSRTHKRIRNHGNPTLTRTGQHLRQTPKQTHKQNRNISQRAHPQPRNTRLLRMVPKPIHDTPSMGNGRKSPPHPLRAQMARRMGHRHGNSRILSTPSRKQNLMHSTPQIHVIVILHAVKKPITQERLTQIAEDFRYQDTPQSLRSRMVELERAGYVHRVDRNGISERKRPCWRWQLTKKGEELMEELLDTTTPDERK